MTKTNILLTLFVCMLFFINCTKTDKGDPILPSDPCAGLSFKFTTDVQPVINTFCANSCHGASSTNSGGPLTDYNKIFAKSADIKIQVQSGLMPKTGTLTADQKNKIICWINSGAPNN